MGSILLSVAGRGGLWSILVLASPLSWLLLALVIVFLAIDLEGGHHIG